MKNLFKEKTVQIGIPEWVREENPYTAEFCDIINEALRNNPGMSLTANYTGALLKLYAPNDILLENLDITTGAANLTADCLSANSLKLKLGAGNAQIECLNAYSNIDIKGGAGQITILSGTLNDLTLDIGVGELNVTAALLGECDLKFGVGESNLTIVGSREDYTINIEKGLGNINIDGKTCSDFGSSGSGQNYIELEGGVGTINLKFQEN